MCARLTGHRVSSLQQHALNKQMQRRLKRDRNASWLIHFGGWLVLAALLVLLWHLISVVLPMVRSPELVESDKQLLNFEGQLLYATQIQQENVFITRHDDCSLVFYQQAPHIPTLKSFHRAPFACSTQLSVFEENGYHYLSSVDENHILRIKEMTFLENSVQTHQVFSERLPNLFLSQSTHWQIYMQDAKWSIIFSEGRSKQVYWLDPKNQSEPAHHFYSNVSHLYPLPDSPHLILLQGQKVQHVTWRNEVLWESTFESTDEPQLAEQDSGEPNLKHEKVKQSPIRFLQLLPSGKGFLLQNHQNELQKWVFTNLDGKVDYTLSYAFEGKEPVRQLMYLPSMHLAVVLSDKGVALLNFTTGEVVNEQAWSHLLVSPDHEDFYWHGHQIGIVDKGMLRLFDIERAKASITLSNLFSKLTYEGYSEPEFIWQSSAGADNHQAKYSVIPLIIGSVKAALLAISVALPLGLGAAVYTAYFAPPAARKWLKPAIEMLEAIPSVVLGFIAAIWLLPLDEASLASVLGFFLLLPLYCAVVVLFQRFILKLTGHTLPINLQFCFVYMLIFAFILSEFVPFVMQQLGQWGVPALFFLEEQDTHSKNTVVVAMALGIAIAPSIYSLAEDAIYEVPGALKKASYALGATRLQTLLNVVLKVAYPGILSALMLGFSRALGETMILLMVTGNTPIAEWDLMAGMRSLTANLAIELPESEVGGVQYQVLFFTALLLLVFTMGINTIAELLRLRLKKKYRHE